MADQMEVVHRKAAGLQTSPNSGLVPEGALQKARNATTDRQGVVSSRRGFETYATLSNPGVGAWEYLQKLLVLDEDTLKYDAAGDGNLVTWPGFYLPPPGHRMRGVEVDEKFMFTTSSGPYIQESPSSTPRRAGIPAALDVQLSSSGDGLIGCLLPDSQVSYRVIFGKEKLPPGAPSFQEVIGNVGQDVTLSKVATTITVTHLAAHGFVNGDTVTIVGLDDATYIEGAHVVTVTGPTTYTYTVTVEPTEATATGKAGKKLKVDLEIRIPAEVVAGWWVEVYRTINSSALAWPGDTHYKVAKHTITAAEIAAGVILLQDVKDDSFLSGGDGEKPEELYTNPGTREGIRGANYRPPWCEFIVHWRGHTHFAGRIRREHQLDLTLDSISFLDGDSISIISDGITRTYTAGAAENHGTLTFKRWTTETLETVNIRKTAKSLVHIINGDASSRVYAFYVWEDVGQIRLVRRDLMDHSFVVKSNRQVFGEMWSPDIPWDDNSLVSEAETKKHVVARSKFQKPESVPLLSTSEVGKLGQEILGLQPLMESLLIFAYSGTYEETGETDGNLGDSFAIREVDTTLRLLNADCLCSLDTVGFGWFNGGICRVSHSSSLIVSTPQDAQAKKIARFQGFAEAFFVPYESEHKLLAWVPSSTAAQTADHCYVYDYLLNTWMGPWEISAKAAVVIGDLLYVCRADKARLIVERKSLLGGEDFIDEDETVVVSAVGTTIVPRVRFGTTDRVVSTVTVEWPIGEFIEHGWLFSQGMWRAPVRDTLNNGDGTWVLTLDELLQDSATAPTQGIAAGVGTISPSIDLEVEYVDEDGGDASVEKEFSHVIFAFESDEARHHEAGFSSNMYGKQAWCDELMWQRPGGGWGRNWGRDWGGTSSRTANMIRIPVPQDHARCQRLRPTYRHRVALEPVNLILASVWFRPYSNKGTREAR